MLFVVPTPIGNLRDITLRALDVLKAADVIVCEDTRHSQKLLAHYEIQRPLLSFHEHSGPGRLAEILNRVQEGQSVALISDSGTPLISDPGFELVHEAILRRLPLEVLPGPVALVTALAASGLPVDSFSFWGFLPQKSSARRRFLEGLKEHRETLIFYESPFRLVRTLGEMKEAFGDREAAVAREMSKRFEEISRGYFSELIQHYHKKKVLGEIVLLVSGEGRKEVLHG